MERLSRPFTECERRPSERPVSETGARERGIQILDTLNVKPRSLRFRRNCTLTGKQQPLSHFPEQQLECEAGCRHECRSMHGVAKGLRKFTIHDRPRRRRIHGPRHRRVGDREPHEIDPILPMNPRPELTARSNRSALRRTRTAEASVEGRRPRARARAPCERRRRVCERLTPDSLLLPISRRRQRGSRAPAACPPSRFDRRAARSSRRPTR